MLPYTNYKLSYNLKIYIYKIIGKYTDIDYFDGFIFQW